MVLILFGNVHPFEDKPNEVVNLLDGLIDRVFLYVPHGRVFLVIDRDLAASLAHRGAYPRLLLLLLDLLLGLGKR